MRTTHSLLALALAGAALQPALAGTVLLNFEDLTSTGRLSEKYASQGVKFSSNAWGVTSADSRNGCTGNIAFTRPNSCGAVQLTSNAASSTDPVATSFTIELTSGFDKFSFAYSTYLDANLMVLVFDAAGNELGGNDGLVSAGTCAGGALFCNWKTQEASFSGLARSITVSGIDKRALLDDLSFNIPGSTPGRLPEPGSIALTLAALGALGWARRRGAR